MNFNENLADLRKKLDALGVDALLVAMNNFYGNFRETLSGIARISGFTGSNGRAIVSLNAAVLSVDGRYTKQAEEQTDRTIWQIRQYPEFDIDAIAAETVKPGQKLAIGAFSITYKSYLRLKELSEKVGFSLQVLEECPLFSPEKSREQVYLMREVDAGESRKSKIDRLKQTLLGGEAVLLTDAAVVGWAFGVRIAPTTDKCILPNCVAFIPGVGKPKLFCDLPLHGACDDFDFADISEFESVMNAQERVAVKIDFSRTPLHFPNILERNGFSVKSSDVSYGSFEAIKNKTEIRNLRTAAERASLSFIRTLAFAENANNTSEQEIADFFENDLRQYDNFVSLSFNSISAFRSSSALVHYVPKTCGSKAIASDGLLLFDAGAHFTNATTDMTRTVYRGNNPDDELRKIYSTVLRSIIMYSSMKFPDKSKACYLDAIARFFIWHKGYDYQFGTGHGVGSFGNVHEHPRISPTSSEEITENMVTTVEPGIYREDFGIRMENMLLTRASGKLGFVEFETLNFIPFCRKLIEGSMFSNFELEWLNHYHQTVYTKFAGELRDDALALEWLKKNTEEI